ncbi:12497_t:CDS:2 [Acaulospora colombiana]|uniref:12497_t:CDS:1 n=1 Tax=Acaulospora colombiana TaxID=27376 RepID=A0ACA9LSS2_9GLOM|nr:12497_t:CDS:2 [Acaulospora colombiana]
MLETTLAILSQDFLKFYEAQKYCDLLITVGQGENRKTFKAHSVVLSARSAYFDAALSKNWSRSKDGLFTFEKPNLRPVIFDKILRYIYGGALNLSDYQPDVILELLQAFDEFNITDLFNVMQMDLLENHYDWLVCHFSTVFEVSNSQSFGHLRNFCTGILENHPTDIFEEDFWNKVQPFEVIFPPDHYRSIMSTFFKKHRPINSLSFPRRGPIKSKLITTKHASLISSWIDFRVSECDYGFETYQSYKESPYTFELLLRGSVNGFTPRDFHEHCDDRGPTVVIIKVCGTREILGGYNPNGWSCGSNSGGYRYAKNAFIFGFDTKDPEKVVWSRVIRENYAILNHDNAGPWFGDLRIQGKNFREECKSTCKKEYYEKSIRQLPTPFSVEDYEVFRIVQKSHSSS